MNEWKRRRYGRPPETDDEDIRLTLRGGTAFEEALAAWWRRVRAMVTAKAGVLDEAAVTVSGGADNGASAAYATVPGGSGASAYLYGQWAYASGRFGGLGSAQVSVLVLRRSFTSGGAATARELFLDGAGLRLELQANKVYAFEALLAGWHDNKGAQVAYAWRVDGLARRGGTAASTTLVTSTVTALGADPGAPGAPFALADTVNGALGLWAMATGVLGDVQYYVARVSLVEVSL